MASPKNKQPVLIDKDLHSKLKTKLKLGNISDGMTKVVSLLVEMYLNGEVKVIIPERQL